MIAFEEICKEFNDYNFAVITPVRDFVNTYTTKIEYRCHNSHIGKVLWHNWKRSRKCKQCSIEKSRSESTESVRNLLESEGYKLLSEYTSNSEKVHYICPNGHKHYTYINNWKRGCRCGYCTGKYKLYIPDVINSIENEGYKVVNKDIKYAKEKIHTMCPNGHDYYVMWSNWSTKFSRCPKCQMSSGEIELKKYVDNLKIEYIDNDRSTILNPISGYHLELDLWFPELNKAIEFNGTYWHSKPEKIERDAMKKQVCEENNIQLLTIWEDEWNNNNKEVRSTIKVFLK